MATRGGYEEREGGKGEFLGEYFYQKVTSIFAWLSCSNFSRLALNNGLIWEVKQ